MEDAHASWTARAALVEALLPEVGARYGAQVQIAVHRAPEDFPTFTSFVVGAETRETLVGLPDPERLWRALDAALESSYAPKADAAAAFRISLLNLGLHCLESRQQFGHIILDDAPERVVVDAEIAMDEAVSGGDDDAPGDFGMGCADRIRDMGGGFADQLQVAQGGVVGQATGHETGLVESVGIAEYLFSRNRSYHRDRSAIRAGRHQTLTCSCSM